MIGCIPSAIQQRYREGKASGDQDVLNYCFSNWGNENLSVDEIYNVSVQMFDKRKRKNRIDYKYSDIAVLHFVGPKKPWKEDKNKSIARCLLRGKLGLARSIYLFWKYYEERN